LTLLEGGGGEVTQMAPKHAPQQINYNINKCMYKIYGVLYGLLL
jgi:hypothetical protein